MQTWTNLAWPDDPYRTGQQLYRKPAPRLAAFTTWPTRAGDQAVAATSAIVYLSLHRTRRVEVTGQRLAFGFRAASATDPAQVPAVAAVADLDLMQARRHAAVLTGYGLTRDLTGLRQSAGATAYRGLAALADDWADRNSRTGRAILFDCDLDLPGGRSLAQSCLQVGITAMTAADTREHSLAPAACAVERALVIALLCARHSGRYEWTGTLDTKTLMDASAWDTLPWQETTEPPAAAPAGGQQR
jgi:hypothetical protein